MGRLGTARSPSVLGHRSNSYLTAEQIAESVAGAGLVREHAAVVSIDEFVRGVSAGDFAALQASDGRRWLDALPELVREACRSWNLSPDGDDMRHGYHAVVLPVSADGRKCVLKLAWPRSSIVEESIALGAWRGRGAVELLQADLPSGILLLERLDPTKSLTSLPLFAAASEAGLLLRQMSVTAPPGIRTADDDADAMTRRVQTCRGLIDETLVDIAESLLNALVIGAAATLVHGDLHYENVLSGERRPWLAVDPKPVTGDAERGIAELLFTRVDELDTDAAIRDLLGVLVEAARLDAARAAGWAFVRTVDYWLWAAANGLTVDPIRCERVALALQPLLG